VAVNIDKVLDVFGTRGILASLLFIGLACATGWLLGGPANETRRVLALATGQRNIAAAVVVGSGSFSDPRVVVMVIVVAIIGLIVLMLLSHALGKQSTIVTRRRDCFSRPIRIHMCRRWGAPAFTNVRYGSLADNGPFAPCPLYPQ
jgi:hypothetical protein